MSVPQRGNGKKHTNQCADGLNGGVEVDDALVNAHLVAVEGVGTLSSGV